MYKDDEYFLYETDYFSVTVMTDTTERAPTFSIPPYENFDRPAELSSPVYLHLPGVTGAAEGWSRRKECRRGGKRRVLRRAVA